MTRSERFKQARLNAGLTRRMVEELTYVTRPTISKTENPKHDHLDFKFETVYRLAQLYNVDVVWLMKGDINENTGT